MNDVPRSSCEPRLCVLVAAEKNLGYPTPAPHRSLGTLLSPAPCYISELQVLQGNYMAGPYLHVISASRRCQVAKTYSCLKWCYQAVTRHLGPTGYERIQMHARTRQKTRRHDTFPRQTSRRAHQIESRHITGNSRMQSSASGCAPTRDAGGRSQSRRPTSVLQLNAIGEKKVMRPGSLFNYPPINVISCSLWWMHRPVSV